MMARGFQAEAASLEPLLVQIRLGQIRDALADRRDMMPAGSVGAGRLTAEIEAVNTASIVVGKFRADA